MELKPVLYILGILLSVLAISMTIPMMADLYVGHEDWKVFFLCMIITAFFGGILTLSNSGRDLRITHRQGFLMITLSWVLLSFFSAIPLWMSGLGISFTDAFFEATSGITTTGATVLTGLDDMPRGILLWRALLQWLGGIGIVLMAMSILPFLKVGGMQLFQTELSESEKALPRTAKFASSIGAIYLALTVANILCYRMAGMGFFDATAHALTTISTGGFSTRDSSFTLFEGVAIEIIAITFMILGGLPFVLYMKGLGGDWNALFRDSQVRWFLSIVLIVTVIMTSHLVLTSHAEFGTSLLHATFNIVSVITGTGYANEDYGRWGGLPVSIFFFLMVVGACAGSTTCGIKVFRFQVLYAVTNVQIKKLIFPNGVFIPHYNGRPIPESVPISVMSFFFLFALTFSLVSVALSMVGLDFITAMSASATAISNVGPGLGDIIGPAGTFKPLPDSAKWILSAAMILGRLELFPLLVMLSPQFWRK